MTSFCDSVKANPCRLRESSPLIGSSRAFPTACAALERSMFITVAMSRIAPVAFLNVAPVMFLNPRRTVCMDSIFPLSMPERSRNSTAILWSASALVQAPAPVASTVDASNLIDLDASSAACTDSCPKLTTALVRAADASTSPSFRNEFSVSFVFLSSSPRFFTALSTSAVTSTLSSSVISITDSPATACRFRPRNQKASPRP